MTVTEPAYQAVLLAGFGGPEGPEDVMPFLRNVTRGRGIPEERLVEVSHHYYALGGSSPINAQNRALRTALQAELDRRGWSLPVLWGNRNWSPYLADEVTAAAQDGRVTLLGLATSAYSSYSSCRQYREDFGAALAASPGQPPGEPWVGTVRIDKVRPYFDLAGFLDPFADGCVAALKQALASGLTRDQLEIVFTTHSVPAAMADTSGSAALGDHRAGGAYVAQHLAACRVVADAVTERSGAVSWQLAYQSRSGPPALPWLEPDVNEVIAGLPAAGRRGVIVVPIGFVSDHVEVVWDLDHEARDTATQHQLWFARVPTPGTDPRFVAALADLIDERLAIGARSAARAGGIGTAVRPDFCAPSCCVNLRTRKPTTAGQDSAVDWSGTGVTEDVLAASGIVRPEPGSSDDRPADAPAAGSTAATVQISGVAG